MAKENYPHTSRRTVLGTGLAMVAAGIGVRSQTARAEPMLEKKDVQYQDQPKDGKHCSQCTYFVAPNACQQVKGEISPNGYCGLFAPKAT
ncbi:MAG: hypothetical protein ACP5M5_03370 [Acidibrevibacterium sp.]|uniref:hypothetical protein n=1 Tax=Acidibrevibacterium sp. TaxID=2606776 RepID=UPI003CFF9AF4